MSTSKTLTVNAAPKMVQALPSVPSSSSSPRKFEPITFTKLPTEATSPSLDSTQRRRTSFLSSSLIPSTQPIPNNERRTSLVDSQELAQINQYSPPDYSIAPHEQNSNDVYELNDFTVMKQVGKGAFAKVFQVKRNLDGKVLAMKIMRKDILTNLNQIQHLKNEKQVMQASTGSSFITQLLTTFQDPVHLYMVQEYLPGGDLFYHIKQQGHFDRETAQFYAAEVFFALNYLHNNRIIYRDLKPENVLLDVDGHVKLADFGFARQIDDKALTFCGTPSYLAPEIIMKRPYGFPVDWWAYGILIFELLSGCSPFQESQVSRTYQRILAGKIRWPPTPSKYFDPSAESIINQLIYLHVNKRLGTRNEQDIKMHPWFEGVSWDLIEMRRVPPPRAVQQCVRRRALTMEETIVHIELSGENEKSVDDDLFQGF